MRSVLFVSFSVIIAACSKPNPGACCVGADDCAAAHLEAPKGCEAGLYCSHNECVPADCTVDADCPTEHPVCSNGSCVDCDGDHACTARAPVCEQPIGTCDLCTVDDDCGEFESTPHCDPASGGCVECVSSAQCSASKPVCDQNQCRSCTKDTDCDTGACNDDGSCVDEDAIVWVDPNTGVDSGSCTRAAPCRNLVYAVVQSSAERPHIVYTAAAAGQATVSITPGGTTAPMLFLHAHGMTFIPPQGGGSGYIIDTTLPMLIRDAVFSGNYGPIRTRASMLTLDHVTIHNAKHLEVGGNTVATDLSIDYSVDDPSILVANGVDFTIDRGVIHGGETAISAQSGAHVHLKNLLVYGVNTRPLELALAVGELQFSTIVGGAASVSAPCALTCAATLHVTSSIIWAPTCIDGSPHDAVPDSCSYQSSIVSNASPPPGTTNPDPMFVNEAMRDFHIQPTSPAHDAVDTGPDRDFEGDPRPGGPKFDIGADEIP